MYFMKFFVQSSFLVLTNNFKKGYLLKHKQFHRGACHLINTEGVEQILPSTDFGINSSNESKQ